MSHYKKSYIRKLNARILHTKGQFFFDDKYTLAISDGFHEIYIIISSLEANSISKKFDLKIENL